METCCEHVVQFYERDDYLTESVAHYLAEGFRAGDAGLVIATPPHLEALEARLDLARLREEGRYLAVEAEDALGRFMVDGRPDPTLFRALVGGHVARISRPGARVRAFGEMVALLWARGEREAALQLEELWNDLARVQAFSLLCAYPLGLFRDSDLFLEVCHRHTGVLPAESCRRPESLALLQQRAQAMEEEAMLRRRAEAALSQQQERFSMAVALAGVGTWELDLRTQDLVASTLCKAHFGLKPEETLTYAEMLARIHADDLPGVRESLHRAIASNGEFSLEFRVGEDRWLSSAGRCYLNGEHRLLGMTLDVTARKATERPPGSNA